MDKLGNLRRLATEIALKLGYAPTEQLIEARQLASQLEDDVLELTQSKGWVDNQLLNAQGKIGQLEEKNNELSIAAIGYLRQIDNLDNLATHLKVDKRKLHIYLRHAINQQPFSKVGVVLAYENGMIHCQNKKTTSLAGVLQGENLYDHIDPNQEGKQTVESGGHHYNVFSSKVPYGYIVSIKSPGIIDRINHEKKNKKSVSPEDQKHKTQVIIAQAQAATAKRGINP